MKNQNIEISKFELNAVSHVIEFTDKWIGKGYYTEQQLKELVWQSKGCSFLAWDLNFTPQKLIALRLTLAPGAWLQNPCSPTKWNVAHQKVGYFKSLFVHGNYRSIGLGQKLSNLSLNLVSQLGGEAVITHSWLESPNNSSQIYLKKMGFIEIATHPKFWNNIDYHCTRCAPNKCICTAVEMIKYI